MITIGNTTGMAANSGAGPFTFSHDNNGDFLVVTVAYRDDANNSITVTYNGASLTSAKSKVTSSGAILEAEIFYITNPASGSNTVSISSSGSIGNVIGASAISLSGVDEVSPVDATAEGGEAPGTENPRSSSITTASANALIIDAIADRSASLTVGGSQTQVSNVGSGDIMASSYRTATTAGSYAMDWTPTEPAEDWAHAIVSFKTAGLTTNSKDNSVKANIKTVNTKAQSTKAFINTGVGNAVSLNGSTQYGKLINYSAISSLTTFTIEGWFYQDSTNTTAYSPAAQIGAGSSLFANIITENGTPSEGINFAAKYSGVSADGYNSSGVFTTDTFVHIALVHTVGEKSKVYKDGIEISYTSQQSPTGTQVNPGGMDLLLGADTVTGKYFKGRIACMRVWNTARSQTEISSNKDYYLDPTKESGLIINLNFDEGSGSTVSNDATSSHDLTLFNSPSWITGPSLTTKVYPAGTGSIYPNYVRAFIKRHHGKKTFEYRVYDQTGNIFIKTWTTEVISEPTFRMIINGGPGEMVVRLVRPFDNFGEEVDVKLFNNVRIYVFDKDVPGGRLLYSGYISGYRPVLEEHKEYVEVTLLHYISEMSEYMLRDGTGATSIVQNSLDPAQIFRNIITYYRTDGGFINYSATSINDTSTTVSYTFSTYSVKEAIDKAIELTPVNWFWRIDADNLVYLNQSNFVNADHSFTVKKHFRVMETWRRGEDLINRVYFVGADSGDPPTAMYRVYSNSASISSYKIHATKYVDKRVSDTTTASIIANRIINTRKDPEIRTSLIIFDNNGPDNRIGYDIESVKPGDTMKIKGLKQGLKTVSYWDQMTWDVDVWDQTISFSSVDIIQIQSVEYHPDYIRIEASSRLPEISKRIEDVYRNQEQVATVTTPSSPTVG